MKQGVYLSKCGTMFCVYEKDDVGNSFNYSRDAFPMTMTKLRRWIYLGEP
jgi:hypothetical protein